MTPLAMIVLAQAFAIGLMFFLVCRAHSENDYLRNENEDLKKRLENKK
jgi:hypothetical protein